MKIHHITYSITGEHINQLKQALDLQSVTRIVDISPTLADARKHISPFPEKPGASTATGRVVLVSDFPLTGKSCLAFNLAKNWLDTSIAFVNSNVSVVIIKPEWQSNWKRKELQDEIEACFKPTENGASTLVIIDDLENIGATQADTDEIFSWLLDPSHSYQKLLIHNEGIINKLLAQNSINNFLGNKKHESTQHILVRQMSYDQEDITKLIHLKQFLKSGYFNLGNTSSTQKQISSILQNIALGKNNNTESYLIGLFSLSSSHVPNNQSLHQALQESIILKSLYKDYQTNIFLNILIQLHQYLKPFNINGFSSELVGKLYVEVANVGWPQYQQVASNLSKAYLVTIDNDSICMPNLFLSALTSFGRSEKTYSLEDYFVGMTLHSCTANLQLGAIHLNNSDYANAIHHFSKCADGTTQKQAVELLTQQIWDASRRKAKDSQLQDLFSFVAEYLGINFASISPRDKYKRYEDAASKLKQVIDEQPHETSNSDELRSLLQQLNSNIEDARKFGDNETKRYERNKLAHTLDKLSKESLHISFHNLYNLTTPVTLPELFNQLQYLSHSDETNFFQLSVDHLVLRLCQFLYERKNVRESFNQLVELVRLGNHAEGLLYSFFFTELFASSSAEVIEVVTSFPPYISHKLDMCEIISLLLFEELTHSQEEKSTIVDNIFSAFFSDMEWDSPNIKEQHAWLQSVEVILIVLNHATIGNKQKHEWLNAIFNNIDPYSEEKANYSNALLLNFSLDVVFSIKANKTNIDLYLDYLNTFVKSNTLFQVYCAIITRFISENKNDFVFELLERNTLTIGIESGFSLNYQIGLASYILWLKQICLQSLISQTSIKLIEDHIERVHKGMENYSDALYVCDKLQWGQNYRDVVTSLKSTLTEIEPNTWQENVSISYVVALRVYSANRMWNEVNSLKEEGSAFCEIHEIQNDACSILNNYMTHPNSESPTVFRDQKRSEFYGLNHLQWGQVIRNIQMGRYVDSVNYLNQNQQTHQTKFEFWYLLGLGYLRIYDDLSAIICFERSAQLSPTYINAYLQIANIHHKLEHSQLEIAILSKAYLVDSKHFDVVFRLAKAHQSQENVIQAIKYYEHAVDLVGKKSLEYQVVLRELVTLYKHEAQWQEALDCSWKAIKHSTAKHEWLLELQDILKERIASEPTLRYIGQIHYQPTVNHLISCLKELEDSEALSIKIATAYFKMGSIGDAWEAIKKRSLDITTIARIMSDAQSDDDFMFYTGLIYYQQEKYEAAILEWAKVIERDPCNYEAHYYLSLANFAAAKINNKLKLSKSLIKSQLEQATKAAFTAFYLGQSRTKTWELLGNIYLLLGQSNFPFLNYSYYSLEEVCFDSPNLELIVALSQVKLFQLTEDFPHGKSQEIRLWLNDAKMQLVDWLQSYVELSRKSYSPSYLNHHLGKTCLQICQIIRHNVQEEEYPSMNLGNYFRTAHKALSNVTESNSDKFPGTYQLMGDLYWEWHYLPGASNEKIAELKSAIQHWEKAQELRQNVKVSRIDRTIREELEISIGNARKKIKKLSLDLSFA